MTENLQAVEALSKLYEKLQAKRDRLREQLREVENETQAVETTLRIMGPFVPSINTDLRGLTQLEALIAIANANDKKLVVRTARRQMVKAGFFQGTKHVSSAMFTTINRSGKFKRIGAGVYELLEQRELTAKLPLPVEGVA